MLLSTSDHYPLGLLARRLKRVNPLSDQDVQAIEGLPVTVRELVAGQDIVREGDRPSQSCFVLDGWAYSYKLIEEGRRQILAFHLRGELPDLLDLRMGVADFSVCALTKVTVAFIPHEALCVLTSRHPALAVALWHLTLVEAAALRERITGLGRRPANERLAHLFCELHARQSALALATKGECSLPMTQTDLADALGMTSVHVNRSLRELRGNGLVTLKGRRLSIHDWRGLASLAGFHPSYLHLDTLEPTHESQSLSPAE